MCDQIAHLDLNLRHICLLELLLANPEGLQIPPPEQLDLESMGVIERVTFVVCPNPPRIARRWILSGTGFRLLQVLGLSPEGA